MRPLRVAYPVSRLTHAGAERQMVALAKRLPRDRFTIDFLARAGAGPLDAELEAAGFRVHHLYHEGTATRGPWLRASAIATRVARYARVVRANRYDIIDAWLYPSDVFAALCRFITRTPVVLSGQLNIDPHDGFGALSRAVDRFANRRFDAVVAICDTLAEQAIRNGVPRQRIHIIRNGVELIPLATDEQRRIRRRVFGIAGDEFLIGCVANYNEVKRHALLIDAFATVAAERPDARLVLVGEGPMRADLERQVDRLGLGGRVRIHGRESDPLPLYAAFDLVVQASVREGLPNALLEAAVAGRPIVATAAGGSGEVVVDGKTGLLVPVEDERALASAIRTAMDDPALQTRLGMAARAFVAATYGMDRFVGEWAAFYDAMAAAKGVSR